MSLLLAGALTWVLVRDLEFRSVQDQLDRQIVPTTLLVRHQECTVRPLGLTSPGACLARGEDNPADFQARLNEIVLPTLSGDRLLLLDAQRRVVFDSANSPDILGTTIPIAASKRVANVFDAQTTLAGESFFVSAVRIPPARDPLFASYVVVAQPQSLIASTAAGDLAERLLAAGGAALVVAVLLIIAHPPAHPARRGRRGYRGGQLLAAGRHQRPGRDRHARIRVQSDGGGGGAGAQDPA
jgi:hypothetical protein